MLEKEKFKGKNFELSGSGKQKSKGEEKMVRDQKEIRCKETNEKKIRKDIEEDRENKKMNKALVKCVNRKRIRSEDGGRWQRRYRAIEI